MIIAALMLFQEPQSPPAHQFVIDPVRWEERPIMPPPREFSGSGAVGLDCAVLPDRRLTDCKAVVEFPAGQGLDRWAVRAAETKGRLAAGEWPARVRFTLRAATYD